MKRVHGIIKPDRRGHTPARVVNVQTNKHKKNRTIQIDKLKRMEDPVIGVHRRLGGIGDVLMTTPLLKAIKKLIPHCTLIYITDLLNSQGALADVIKHNPYVDKLISNVEKGQYKYDYIVDITATGLGREKPGMVPPNRIDMFAGEVGISVTADPVPTYIVTDQEKKVAIKRIKDEFLLGAKRKDVNIIIIQARSNDARRTWPLYYTEELCDMLAKDPKNRVIVIDWGDAAVRWKPKTRIFPVLNETLPPIAALVEQCDLVICPDSSTLHLAGALGKKTIAIFGPIPPESRINHYYNATAVVVRLPCSFCWYAVRCLKNNTTNQGKLDCLIKINPQMVFDAIQTKLAGPLKVQSVIRHGSDMTKVGKQDPIILVRRSTPGIGDLVMATTAIEALKIKFPKKDIHVAVRKELCDVLKNNKNIDAVLDIAEPINQKRYHMIMDISSPCATYEAIRLRMGKTIEKNRVELFAEALEVRGLIPDIKPTFYLSQEELKNGKEFLKLNGQDKNKKTIGIALSTAEFYRNWPIQHYKQLINILKSYYNLVIFNSREIQGYDGTINVCGLPFRQAAGILGLCDGLITPDTGLLHIAEALGIPTIALFGPIDYKARCKGYSGVTVLIGGLPCSPCWRNSTKKCIHKDILKQHSHCMEVILPKHVVKTVNKKFRKGK